MDHLKGGIFKRETKTTLNCSLSPVSHWLSSFLCVPGVTTAGRVHSATSACRIPAAFMVRATSPGSAPARRTGEACCVTKVRSFYTSPISSCNVKLLKTELKSQDNQKLLWDCYVVRDYGKIHEHTSTSLSRLDMKTHNKIFQNNLISQHFMILGNDCRPWWPWGKQHLKIWNTPALFGKQESVVK